MAHKILRKKKCTNVHDFLKEEDRTKLFRHRELGTGFSERDDSAHFWKQPTRSVVTVAQ